MRATKIFPAVLLVFAGAAAAADNPLDGKWAVASRSKDGKTVDTWVGAVREQSGGKYTMSKAGGKSVSGTMTADAASHTVDMMPNEGQYKGKALHGIYRLEGDTLTVAFAEPGKDRPADVKGGEGITVVVYKRMK